MEMEKDEILTQSLHKYSKSGHHRSKSTPPKSNKKKDISDLDNILFLQDNNEDRKVTTLQPRTPLLSQTRYGNRHVDYRISTPKHSITPLQLSSPSTPLGSHSRRRLRRNTMNRKLTGRKNYNNTSSINRSEVHQHTTIKEKQEHQEEHQEIHTKESSDFMRQAFYNTMGNLILLLGIAALALLYFVFEQFVKPLVWALLCGALLHPIKVKTAKAVKHWLQDLQTKKRPLFIGILLVPFQIPKPLVRFLARRPERMFVVTLLLVGMRFLETVQWIVTNCALVLWKCIDSLHFGVETTVNVLFSLSERVFSFEWGLALLLSYFVFIAYCYRYEYRKLLRVVTTFFWLLLLTALYPLLVNAVGFPIVFLGFLGWFSLCITGLITLYLQNIERKKVAKTPIQKKSNQSVRKPSTVKLIGKALKHYRGAYTPIRRTSLILRDSTDRFLMSSNIHYNDDDNNNNNNNNNNNGGVIGEDGEVPLLFSPKQTPGLGSSRGNIESGVLMTGSTELIVLLGASCPFVVVPRVAMWICAFIITHLVCSIAITIWGPKIIELFWICMKKYARFVTKMDMDDFVPSVAQYIWNWYLLGDNALKKWLQGTVDFCMSVFIIFVMISGSVLLVVFFGVNLYAETELLVTGTDEFWQNQGKNMITELLQNFTGRDFDSGVELVNERLEQWTPWVEVEGKRWALSMLQEVVGEQVDVEALAEVVLKRWNITTVSSSSSIHSYINNNDKICDNNDCSSSDGSSSSSSNLLKEESKNEICDIYEKNPISSIRGGDGLLNNYFGYNFFTMHWKHITWSSAIEILSNRDVLGFFQENISTLGKIVGTAVNQLKSNIETIWWILNNIWSGLQQGVNFVFSLLLFLTALFYLLNTNSSVYMPLEWIMLDPSSESRSAIQTLSNSIEEVFVSSFKIALFHGLWCWLTFTIFECNLTYIVTLLQIILAFIPILGTYWLSVPSALELWLIRGRPVHGIVLFLLHFFATWVDSQIYSEIHNSHYYVSGLSVVGGLYFYGFEGVILGPMVLSGLLVLAKLLKSVRQRWTDESTKSQGISNSKRRRRRRKKSNIGQ